MLAGPIAIAQLRTMATVRRVALAALSLVALTGCGSEDPQTPVACLAPADAYLSALEAAPDAVRLEATTPISRCLTAGQDAGGLAQAGESMVLAATRLNSKVREDADSDAALQLGYLVGAVDRGAERTGGIHADLVRRLGQSARFDRGEGRTPGVERAFERGHAAGRRTG